MVGEINHRAKNLLSVVQAVARQTRRYGDPTGYAERLNERINALAECHDLLVESRWQAVDIRALIAGQLKHLGDLVGTRIDLRGAPIPISPHAAQTLAMCFHELSTNALKYGALSTGTGRVVLDWGVDPGGRFQVSWRETGGGPPPVDAKHGFGHKVLTEAARGLGGLASISADREGLHWTFSGPANRVLGER